MNVSFPLRQTAEIEQVWFRRYAVFRKACFLQLYYTGNSTAAAEKTDFTIKTGKSSKSIIWLARLLNNHTLAK